MLKKRIVGVVTVKDGWAVQSFSYSRYLPLGRPEWLVENLDRWGADEILLQCIDRSSADAGPDFELLDKVARLGLSTPLIYSGGVRTCDEGIAAIQRGADRIAVDTLLRDGFSVVEALAQALGAQAVIASLPMACRGGNAEWFDYRAKTYAPLAPAFAAALEQGAVSEILLTDCAHEGMPAGFDEALADWAPFKNTPLILFGGISDVGQMQALLQRDKVAALAVGNFLSYQEHSIQKIKSRLQACSLRPPAYHALEDSSDYDG
jgi:cyclase